MSGQAFPCLDSEGFGLSMRDPGMTLRDYFAAKAMQGYVACETLATPEEIAKASYKFADAMLMERAEQIIKERKLL